VAKATKKERPYEPETMNLVHDYLIKIGKTPLLKKCQLPTAKAVGLRK